MTTDQTTLEAGQLPPSEPVAVPQANQFLRVTSRADRTASSVFIMPSVLVVLFLAIFPLIISLYLSLSRFQFVKGGFKITFVGLANFRKLFLGSEKSHLLGVFGTLSGVGWMVFASIIALLIYALFRGFIQRRFKDALPDREYPGVFFHHFIDLAHHCYPQPRWTSGDYGCHPVLCLY